MENQVTWGVPTQRTRKVEKFNTPVITMSAIAEGTGRKFSFNKAAQDLLGLVKGEAYVGIGFSGDNVYVKSFDNDDSPTSFKLTNTFTFSNKKYFEYLAKLNGLDTSTENHLHIEELEGQGMCKVALISQDGDDDSTEETAKTEETVEVEEVDADADVETNTNVEPESEVVVETEEEGKEGEW